MNSGQFEIIFDGPAVEDSTIDARDLAGSMLALGEIVDQASEIATEGRAKSSLRVKAGFVPGSFEISFEVIQSGLDGLLDIFSSKSAGAVANILEIIGFTATGSIGLFQLIKWLRGKKPDHVEMQAGERVSIHFNIERIEVHQLVYKLYENRKARDASEKFVKPLKDEGVDQIRIRQDSQESVLIDKEDAGYFATDSPEHTMVTENNNEVVVTIISVSFKPGEKWRVSDGSETPFYVSILDEGFFAVRCKWRNSVWHG